jgi:hypothetical protein
MGAGSTGCRNPVWLVGRRLMFIDASDDDHKTYAEHEAITIHTVRFHLHTALARSGEQPDGTGPHRRAAAARLRAGRQLMRLQIPDAADLAAM